MHVPEDWEYTTIEKHIDLLSGFPFKSDDYSNDPNDIPLLRGDNIEPGSLRWRDARRWPGDKYKELSKYQLQAGDFVIAMDRTWISGGLKVAEVKANDLPCLLVQRVSRIRARKSFSQSLLKQVFSTHRFEQYVKGVQTETAVPHISAAQIKEFPIPVPPLLEQQKIAQILSTWDKAIEKLETLIVAKQKRKKALMQQLLTGKKRFAGFEGEWKSARLMKLLQEEKARNKDCSITRVLSVTNRSGFVLPEEQFSRQVASSNLSNYKIVCKGQFGYNPSRINVGSFARLDSYDVGVLSPMYVVFSIDDSKLNSDFFLNWMGSHEAKQRIISSTQGTVRDSVGFDALSSFHIKLPTVEEQQKIASVLSAADTEIETHKNQLAALKQQKKGLMQQLLTGKKRVNIDKEA